MPRCASRQNAAPIVRSESNHDLTFRARMSASTGCGHHRALASHRGPVQRRLTSAAFLQLALASGRRCQAARFALMQGSPQPKRTDNRILERKESRLLFELCSGLSSQATAGAQESTARGQLTPAPLRSKPPVKQKAPRLGTAGPSYLPLICNVCITKNRKWPREACYRLWRQSLPLSLHLGGCCQM